MEGEREWNAERDLSRPRRLQGSRVPAGASEVLLRFSPPFVGAALLGSYALLVAVALGALRLSHGGSTDRMR
jgi:hypothetical protein